ncbi:Nucleolar protein 56 [Colletotrichum siamense]|uniref:Nucleolar protein 56 n=1 Tax=Colletotrichum chrysophilum TaxID=1836956 RepID=A0AAD9ATJ6_9PEZI|nr:Nucleolar protein 56 [Colletotrichum siamense]XP_053033882.1 snoRNP complex protein nop56 [Colletotrichum chrysophilum]KAF4830087.1 Nucleolar protein 56 [Colletotrichum tropicale]KAF4921727.1 Nucleolar protein 56 [Colletotrichum viniferum]KAF4823818.1 Nucleolar protein 56 [Colletotrichum siamense]KAF4862281.1 Nucleolar protein 56 [Colletotrichum siamense]KAF5494344.1 Nucleolar protein 56 [Colletotrichum siamense]
MAQAVNYLLYEAPMGYGVFHVENQPDSIGLRQKEAQETINDLARFGKMVKLVNFTPFDTGKQALDEINHISEGLMSVHLKSVLELNLPQTSGKKSKVTLAVAEKNLASVIKSTFPGVDCETSETSEVAGDLLRGVRLHADKLLKGLQTGDSTAAGLGLGHSYSRAKVKFSTTKNDNHVIQASATVEFQDKGVNQFFMRVREWYGWHFPELVKIVSDNLTYAKLVLLIGDKSTLNDDRLHDIAAVVEEDGEKAQAIIDAAKVSMGLAITPADLEIVKGFAEAVVQQAEARRATANYLDKKMSVVAPNLQTLIGTPVAARLISHAGSLTALSKYPASTLQILGAEKALFRALKTKSNTPKYGLIYHSSFIGKASVKNKGRISRYLANKCSIASRIDNYTENPTTKFGEALRQQVEDRLEFYATGKKPAKNADVMASVLEQVEGDLDLDDAEMVDAAAEEVKKEKKDKKEKSKDKKEKKEKKRKRDSEVAPAVEEEPEKADGEKKKKKKKKSKDE